MQNRRFFIALFVSIFIFVVIFYFFLEKYIKIDNDKEYWTKTEGPVQITSTKDKVDKKYYVTFYVNFTFSISYKNEVVGKKIQANILEIKKIIKNYISRESYYRINTSFKRNINLVPIIIEKITNYLFIKKDQILDIYFETFFIDFIYSYNFDFLEKSNFLNLGNFYFDYYNTIYKMNIYLVYSMKMLPLSLPNMNYVFNQLKVYIQEKLEQTKLFNRKFSNKVRIKLEKLMKIKVDNIVKEYFKNMNEIKNKRPYKESIFPSVLIAYCIEQ